MFPDQPRKGDHSAIFHLLSVTRHRQSLGEDVDGFERSALEHLLPLRAFEKLKFGQHDDLALGGCQRLPDELFAEREWRVGDDVVGFFVGEQEVHAPSSIATIDQVCRLDIISRCFEELGDRTITTGWLPDIAGEFLSFEKCKGSFWRRGIIVVFGPSSRCAYEALRPLEFFVHPVFSMDIMLVTLVLKLVGLALITLAFGFMWVGMKMFFSWPVPSYPKEETLALVKRNGRSYWIVGQRMSDAEYRARTDFE